MADLQGRLGRANWKGVWGWALDANSHGSKVAVEILLNGAIVGRVVAEEMRPNMTHLRPEQRACGFQFLFPNGLSALSRHLVRVRFAGNGPDLQDSPIVIEASPGFDPALEQTVGNALQVAANQARTAAELDAPLGFVVGEIQRLLEARRELAGDDGPALPRELDSLNARWGEAMQELPALAANGPGPSAATAQRRRILVIGDAAPVLDDSALVLLAHMRSLVRLGAAVEFVPSEHAASATAQVAAVQAMGGLYHAPGLSPSVEDVLRRNRGLYDAVIVHRIGNAEKYSALARFYCPLARVVYSVDSLYFVRMLRRAALQGWSAGIGKGEALRLREMMAAWGAHAVITGSVFEAELLRRGVPQGQVHVVPWPVDGAATQQPAPAVAEFGGRAGVGFVGDFRLHADYDAAAWLVEVLMPAIWAIDPGIGCVLAGCNMPEPLRTLARDGITVAEQPAAAIAELAAPILAGVRLAVATHRAGAGVTPLVVASLAAGIPCVGTSLAYEGLALPDALRGLVADDAASLAALVCRLHDDAQANAELAGHGRRFIAGMYSAAETDRRMQAVIEVRPATDGRHGSTRRCSRADAGRRLGTKRWRRDPGRGPSCVVAS